MPVFQLNKPFPLDLHTKKRGSRTWLLGGPLPTKIWGTSAAQKKAIWDPLEIFCDTWPNGGPGPEMGFSRRALSETRAGGPFALIIKAQKRPKVVAHIEAWYTGFGGVPPASWRSFFKLDQMNRRDQKWASLAELFQNQVLFYFLPNKKGSTTSFFFADLFQDPLNWPALCLRSLWGVTPPGWKWEWKWSWKWEWKWEWKWQRSKLGCTYKLLSQYPYYVFWIS